jgi:hypothetical protein
MDFAALWDDADLKAFLKIKSGRHLRRIKKMVPKVILDHGEGKLVRYDPAEIQAFIETKKTSRPRRAMAAATAFLAAPVTRAITESPKDALNDLQRRRFMKAQAQLS